MSMLLLRGWLIVLFCSWGGAAKTLAGGFPSAAMEAKLARAQQLVDYLNQQESEPLLQELTAYINDHNQLNSAFGIRVQLLSATFNSEFSNMDLALPKLLHIARLSEQYKDWPTHTRALLNLALVYELLKKSETTLQYLQKAERIIRRESLHKLYPRYCIRMASWHRLFGDSKEIDYYIDEAIRTAPAQRAFNEEATALWLKGQLLPPHDFARRKDFALKALNAYRAMNQPRGIIAATLGLAKIHRENNEYKTALAYNDTSLHFMGQWPVNERFMSVYRQRAEIFNQMGKSDSAYHYAKLENHLMGVSLDRESRAKASELDIRFGTQEKEEAIRLQKQALILLILMAAALVVVAAGLYWAYRKQQEAKQTLAAQNQIIIQQSERLKNIDAARSRFFANISHELRTPLTLMLSPISTILKENHLTDRQQYLLKLASRGGDELSNLVNEILDIGKLEAGKMTLTKVPTRLADFFRYYVHQFEPLAARRGIHYQVSIQIEPELTALLDQEKMRQIMNNLLSNAFKFTESGKEVSVVLRLYKQDMTLQVADTGRGIPAADLPYIFERYFQTHQVESQPAGGTGIGLALCKEYADLLGGSIRCTSQVGRGSTFTLMWPFEQVDEVPVNSFYTSETVENSPQPLVNPMPSGGRPQVLVVEDNVPLQQYLRLLLSPQYEVTIADNGRQALDTLLAGAAFDLIISDFMMPIMDGHQLLTALKSNDKTRGLPVVMLTARLGNTDKLKALRIGVDDYVAKPFNEEELLARVANLIANYKSRRAEVAGPPAVVVSEPDQRWLERFELYVRTHFGSSLLDVPTLADEFSMSESTLLRQVKRLTGLTTLHYIQDVRLSAARDLLESRRYNSVGEVARHVGYDDPRSFSRIFRERFGRLPSAYFRA